jgi:hypothetical protein
MHIGGPHGLHRILRQHGGSLRLRRVHRVRMRVPHPDVRKRPLLTRDRVEPSSARRLLIGWPPQRRPARRGVFPGLRMAGSPREPESCRCARGRSRPTTDGRPDTSHLMPASWCRAAISCRRQYLPHRSISTSSTLSKRSRSISTT